MGAVLGAWALPRINERALLMVLTLLLAAFLAWRFSSVSPRWSPTVQRWGRAPVALTCGVAQGATGISGPLVAAWFQGLGVSRERFVVSNTSIFLFTGLTQLVPRCRLTGQWSSQRLWGAALAASLVSMALPFGIRIGRRLDSERFETAVNIVISVCTISLLFRVF